MAGPPGVGQGVSVELAPGVASMDLEPVGEGGGAGGGGSSLSDVVDAWKSLEDKTGFYERAAVRACPCPLLCFSVCLSLCVLVSTCK